MLNKIQKKIPFVISFFIIIQPLLDLYFFYNEKVVDLLGFSPSTIIRIAFIMFLGLFTFFNDKTKNKIIVLIYFIFVGIYSFLHIENSMNFTANTIGTYNLSIVPELFYIIRMTLPIIMCYIIFKSSIDSNNKIKNLFVISVIISLIITISNFFCLSFQSYSPNGILIKNNVISWFFGANNMYNNSELSSRGIFNSANQMSALLTILLPISIFYCYKNNKKANYIFLFLQNLALIMLGTRISSYCWIAVYIVMFCILMYFTKFKIKRMLNKKILMFAILFAISLVFFFKAPIHIRKLGDDYTEWANELVEQSDDSIKTELEAINNEQDIEIKKEKAIGYVKKYYSIYMLNSEFVEKIYDYRKEPVFWINIINKPFSERNNSRQIEQYITEKIYLDNNNKNDKLLGIGFTRFTNGGLYLEKDFFVHFYTIGIIGSFIFIYPYLIILLLALLYFVRNHKNKSQHKIIIYSFSIALGCTISTFSGSVLDQLVITLIMGYICGLILQEIKE